MVLFKSPHPDLKGTLRSFFAKLQKYNTDAKNEVPQNLTTWEWLFESKEFSPLYKEPRNSFGAYIDAATKERLDWPAVKAQSTSLSSCLIRRYGLKPGTTVSLFSTNTIWYPVALFAIIRAGGRVNGASPAYTIEEMAYALKVAKTKILITMPGSLNIALAAAKLVGMPSRNVLLLQGQAEGFVSVQELIREAQNDTALKPYCIPSQLSNKDVCGYLNFSSGTTGLPKAVMLSHHNIIAQCFQLRQLQADPKNYKILAVMPLFHITGLVRFCHYPIFMNGDSVMLPSFTLEKMLNAIVEFQIQELILVPPILLRVARDPIVQKYDLRHVKRWSSGSAPISPEVIKSLQQRFPWTGFRQGYGATESTACISAHPPTHFDYKYATSGGMLVANTVAKVIDVASGKQLSESETGEILAKGPQIAMGYLDNEKATKETFDTDGFFHTGDVGNIDNEGLIYIEDRLKEMIKVKGLQVPPAELEDLLLGHEDVEDCAVVSQANEYAGERPKAFVVLKSHLNAGNNEGYKLFAHVKRHKVRYKWLAEIEFVQNIPKSSTGKLLRRVLKQHERDGTLLGYKVIDADKAKL